MAETFSYVSVFSKSVTDFKMNLNRNATYTPVTPLAFSMKETILTETFASQVVVGSERRLLQYCQLPGKNSCDIFTFLFLHYTISRGTS
jgi:hypothetical protein